MTASDAVDRSHPPASRCQSAGAVAERRESAYGYKPPSAEAVNYARFGPVNGHRN